MRWIVKRAIHAALTIYLSMTITFFLIRAMPGNPIEMLLVEYRLRGVPEELAKAEIAALYNINLDEPWWSQYLRYLWSLLHGDMGKTMISGSSVAECVMYGLPWTVFLVSLSLIISFVIGVTLGMLAAYRRGGIFDRIASTAASISQAFPNYIMAMLLLYYLAIQYKLFPARGSYDINIKPGFTIEFISSVLYHAFLPMMAYVITSFGGWMLAMRSSTIRVLGEDYVVAAEARGLKSRRIATTYVGRNAILPLFASFAIALGYIFGGSTLIETWFAYTGVGMVMGLALQYRDYPLIQGCFLIITVAVVVSNFIADIVYSKLDPRIRIGE